MDLVQLPAKKKEREERKNMENHRDVLTRILFVYARVNKPVGYLQGMNELISVIYYCFYQFGFENDQTHAEADTF